MENKKTAEDLIKESDLKFKDAFEHIHQEEQEIIEKLDKDIEILTEYSKQDQLGL